ncbi:hypothetical protein Q7P37_003186 [Cladosporium fusiforme]
MEDQAYLEPGFDPASLTVPRLRSILVAHGVDYPASSKKSQLVEIFNDNVLPQSRRLRAANARVKRTSRGIENIPSQTSSMTDDEDENEPEPPRSVLRSSRRSTRARTEEAQQIEPTPRHERHTTAPPPGQGVTPRRVSSKHARPLDPVEEPEPKRPASRKSLGDVATPVARKSGRMDDDGSPFSNQNVFQSGGSPPAPRTTDRRRTTYGSARPVSRTRSREARRRTEEHRPLRDQTDGVVVPTRKTFEVPVSRAAKVEVEDEIEPDEEFTAEEEHELVQAKQAGDLVPARRRPKKSSSNAATVGPLALLTALLGGFATLYRQEKLQVGYCGVGYPSTEIAGTQIPDWADVARPACEPCPPHAYCHEYLQTDCEPGFVLTPHPLSLGGSIPLPPSCEPDSARERKIQAVKSRAIEELRAKNAEYECGSSTLAEVKEPELKKVISSMIPKKKMSNEEFEDLWNSALGEIENADEVSGTYSSSGLILRSNSLARIPFSCAVRRSLRETLRQYLQYIVIAVFLASSGLYTRRRITNSRSTETQAKQLAGLALQKLSEQAALNAADPGVWTENYISMAQLRDDVLRDEFSASRRKALWEKVQKKVESNSNVRPMVREGRTGDVGRVWEWVGAVGAIESPYSAEKGERRRLTGGGSGFRDSLGLAGDRMVEPQSAEKQRQQGEVSRWEEKKAYY